MSDLIERLRGQFSNRPTRYECADEIERLRRELAETQHDAEAYLGALGYAVPGAHDGRLSDGTLPLNGIADALQRELAEARELLLAYATDALDDLNNWSGYASEYFQEKHDLAGDRQKWLARIAAAKEGER